MGKQPRNEIRSKRGNPNQWRLVKELRTLGYRVTVRHNQICVDGEKPMTIKLAEDFIAKHHATYGDEL